MDSIGPGRVTAVLRRTWRAGALALCAGAAVLGATPALAQGAVTRLVVPYPAGGPVDLIARIVATKLGEGGGAPVIVENRSGANGVIGVDAVARATPDGHTLVMASTSTHTINPLIKDKLPYDAVKDFEPVILLDTRPYVLVVHPSLPVSSVKDLIALAKSKPGALNYASGGGIGSGNYLAGELFKARAGVDLLHVPYQGGGPALTAVLANQVSVFFAPIPTVLSHLKAGTLKALAVTGAKRSAVVPDLPTMAEAGLPGFEFSIWDGVFAPAGTPRETIDALNAKLVQVMHAPDVKDQFIAIGAEPTSSTPAEMAAYLKADTVKWSAVLKASGATNR